jgi:GNAT superfamily N-acetyltransferase
MTTGSDIDIVQLTRPGEADAAVRQELTACWIAVTNAGGAAGFPFPPVDASHVAPAVEALVAGLDPSRSRILVARIGGGLAGWVALGRDASPLIAHWGVVSHLQTQLAHRNAGIGSALMRRLQEVARSEMGLEQLHLAVRGGMGLEGFYSRLGWRVTGRWPSKLRLAADDTRDEILMFLALLCPSESRWAETAPWWTSGLTCGCFGLSPSVWTVLVEPGAPAWLQNGIKDDTIGLWL